MKSAGHLRRRGRRAGGDRRTVPVRSRALVGDPDLLVLDEPFAGLDPIAMDIMGGLLSELAAGGVTVLFSSHQLDLVEDLCQDVVIIDHGRIVLAGELAELRAKVPQRFVDIRYRGLAPDWSKLASAELVEAQDGVRHSRTASARLTSTTHSIACAAAARPMRGYSPRRRHPGLGALGDSADDDWVACGPVAPPCGGLV